MDVRTATPPVRRPASRVARQAAGLPRQGGLHLLTALLVLSGAVAPLQAQQFAVVTRVTRGDTSQHRPELPGGNTGGSPSGSGGSNEVIARSLTLFHAGRVFDWLPAVGEVTVFEPAHERFVLYSGRRKIATTVSFAEIRRLLDAARTETRTHAQRLAARGVPGTSDIVDPLTFQLEPTFVESFDDHRQVLSLTSPRFQYDVQCGEVPEPLIVTAYLHYADWAARLNYVLHPRSLFPQPRLELNDRLRARDRIPLQVLLRVEFDQPLLLSAEHRFAWQLDDQERQRISHWEQELRSRSLEWVAFRDYQKALLGGQAQARR